MNLSSASSFFLAIHVCGFWRQTSGSFSLEATSQIPQGLLAPPQSWQNPPGVLTASQASRFYKDMGDFDIPQFVGSSHPSPCGPYRLSLYLTRRANAYFKAIRKTLSLPTRLASHETLPGSLFLYNK